MLLLIGGALGCSNDDPAPAGASSSSGIGGGGTGGSSSGVGGAFTGSGGGTAFTGEVYGHSVDTLYRLEPIGSTLTEVGVFDCIEPSDGNDSASGMTDIAIDQSGAMFGVGVALGDSPAENHSLFSIDPTTASCTVVTQLDVSLQGLTFIPTGLIDPDGEVLVGMSGAGESTRIDPVSGTSMPIGIVGAEWTSKGGDVVSVQDAATYYLAAGGAPGGEHLLTIDPSTGAFVADLGDTGGDFLGAGMGYWAGRVYAFALDGKIYEIGTSDGSVSELVIADAPAGISWRGAGVTTIAPIEVPR